MKTYTTKDIIECEKSDILMSGDSTKFLQVKWVSVNDILKELDKAIKFRQEHNLEKDKVIYSESQEELNDEFIEILKDIKKKLGEK